MLGRSKALILLYLIVVSLLAYYSYFSSVIQVEAQGYTTTTTVSSCGDVDQPCCSGNTCISGLLCCSDKVCHECCRDSDCCRGSECSQGQTQSCKKDCTYKTCSSGKCITNTITVTGTQSCSIIHFRCRDYYCIGSTGGCSFGTWSDCNATCPSDSCTTDNDCKVECSSDADCPPQGNTKGKCDLATHTCYWPKCEDNPDCVNTACCDWLVGGTGNCVDRGTIYGRYLCVA